MEKEKMKIYHVLTDRNIGGAGRWLLNYLKYCDTEKFDVRVVLPADSLLCERVEALQIPVIKIQEMEDRSYDKTALSALTKLFLQDQPDVVHTHASLTARMAAKKAGVAHIFHTKHCMENPSRNMVKKMAKRMINHRYSDKVIAVSKAVRRSMIAGGTDGNQIVTIYNGITPLAPLTPNEKQEILDQFHVPKGNKTVGIVARLEEVKDHQTFLRAAERICKVRQDVTFLIVGTGSQKEALQTEVKLMGQTERILFTGFVSDVEKIEAALDVAVITSKQEALCLSLIESMSAGVPAVGTDSGGISEVICHGETGYLVAVGDDAALAERILELLSNRNTYESMSKRGMQVTREYFTAQQMAEKIEQLYMEAKEYAGK